MYRASVQANRLQVALESRNGAEQRHAFSHDSIGGISTFVFFSTTPHVSLVSSKYQMLNRLKLCSPASELEDKLAVPWVAKPAATASTECKGTAVRLAMSGRKQTDREEVRRLRTCDLMFSLCWEKFHEAQRYSLSVDTVLQLPFYPLVMIKLQTKTKNIRNDSVKSWPPQLYASDAIFCV